MSLSYDGKKIIPAPLVTVNKQYTKSSDGKKIGTLFNISLQGTLIPFRGSPSGNYTSLDLAFWDQTGYPPDEIFSGNNEDFNHILRKQEAIRFLFSNDGRSLEWQPSGGQPVVKCNPRISTINFGEGTWADKCTYNIDLQSDWIYISSLSPSGLEDNFEVQLLQDAQEEWSFQETVGFNGVVYSVSHTITAKGIVGYDELGNQYSISGELPGGEAWQHAKQWCDSRAIGVIDSNIMYSSIGFSGWIGGSYTKSTNVDERGGNYSITETWVLSSGNTFIEKDFSVNRDIDGDVTSVVYNGRIFGLENGERAGGDQAIINAKSAIPSDAAAKTETENILTGLLGTYVLGTSPSQKNISINVKEGVVSFSFTWSADPDDTFRKVCEATLSFDDGSGGYNLSLSCDIQGKGPDPSTKLINAKAAIPTDANARLEAIAIVLDQIPSGIVISDTLRSKSVSINETQGSVRASWTWRNEDNDFGDSEINVEISFPSDVTAIIPIPGRAEGPIIQDMETTTHKVVTISLNSTNNLTKPDNATVISLMDTAGEVEPQWILDNDKESYSPTSKKYSRTRTYIAVEA